MISLDVGTRSIICADHEDGRIRRVLYAEHERPCMREGSVFETEPAIAGVLRVREKMGLPAGTEAAVAIAGGDLDSRRVTVVVTASERWTEEDLVAAESKMLEKLSRGKSSTHRVLLASVRAASRADGRPVGSLVGMSGTHGEFDLIATFLPVEAVKRKMTVIERAGFDPVSVAVEPLAVAAALFGDERPSSTFAVIDIGAGTSDIAVIGPSGLVGVASAPFAGDTITTSIASNLGLDYLAADSIKRDASHTVVDQWGDRRTFPAEAILAAAKPGLDEVARSVVASLKALDPDRSVSGMILVGGGSLANGLPEAIARESGLAIERVRVRRSTEIPGIDDPEGFLQGPAFMTLIGIIRTRTSAYAPVHFTLNAKSHFTIERHHRAAHLTVADALTRAGLDPLDLFGEPGRALVVGESIIGGGAGEPPVLSINGRPALLDDPFPAGSDLVATKGANGRDAETAASAKTPDTQTEPLTIAPAPPSAPPEAVALPVVQAEAEKPVAEESMPAPTPESPAPAATDTRGFVRIDGHRVYCGERFHIDPDGSMRENPGPSLAAIIPLPSHAVLRILLNGAPIEFRDRTRRALVNGKRVDGHATVPWDAEVSSARGAWRVFEILADAQSLPRSITVDGVPADLLTPLDNEDRVTLA